MCTANHHLDLWGKKLISANISRAGIILYARLPDKGRLVAATSGFHLVLSGGDSLILQILDYLLFAI